MDNNNSTNSFERRTTELVSQNLTHEMQNNSNQNNLSNENSLYGDDDLMRMMLTNSL